MVGKNYIFDYQDYREFLIEVLGGRAKRTGQRGALARHLSCQTAYLSQILSGRANLNLEQAYQVNVFLAHESEAAEYFLLLVQKERAGTYELKKYFSGKLAEILARRSEIKSRITKNRSVSQNDQAYYYSQWYISAIHIALSITQLQTTQDLSRHFHLEEGVVREALDFLVTTGLAVFHKGRYSIGPSHIHLADGSKFLKHLHTNWRLQAIQALDRRRAEDLHYSVAYSLSRADVARIRQQILAMIEQNMEIVKPSKEEVLYCNTVDFFEVKG